MRIILNILILNFFLLLPVFGQEAEEDSIWNLEDLDFGQLEERTAKKMEESHGWFPKSITGMKQHGAVFCFGDNFDIAKGIRSKSFAPTSNPFSDDIFFKNKEREIKKPNSDEVYGEYPVTIYSEIGYDFLYSPDFPINLYGRIDVSQPLGLLYSREPKKHFLANNGNRKYLKEASIIYMYEWNLNAAFGFQIPIYGAFLKVGEIAVNSYYYLTMTPSFDFVFWSGATQYMQIANAKSEIRYKNGRDTIQMFEDKALPDLNRIRLGIDLAIGWNGAAGPVGTSFELFGYFPLTSVIDDAIWKQYRFGVRYKITFPTYK